MVGGCRGAQSSEHGVLQTSTPSLNPHTHIYVLKWHHIHPYVSKIKMWDITVAYLVALPPDMGVIDVVIFACRLCSRLKYLSWACCHYFGVFCQWNADRLSLGVSVTDKLVVVCFSCVSQFVCLISNTSLLCESVCAPWWLSLRMSNSIWPNPAFLFFKPYHFISCNA